MVTGVGYGEARYLDLDVDDPISSDDNEGVSHSCSKDEVHDGEGRQEEEEEQEEDDRWLKRSTSMKRKVTQLPLVKVDVPRSKERGGGGKVRNGRRKRVGTDQPNKKQHKGKEVISLLEGDSGEDEAVPKKKLQEQGVFVPPFVASMSSDSESECEQIWTCEVCTLENHATAVRCRTCGSARKIDSGKKWTCSICTFLNELQSDACAICQQGKRPPKTVVPQEKDSKKRTNNNSKKKNKEKLFSSSTSNVIASQRSITELLALGMKRKKSEQVSSRPKNMIVEPPMNEASQMKRKVANIKRPSSQKAPAKQRKIDTALDDSDDGEHNSKSSESSSCESPVTLKTRGRSRKVIDDDDDDDDEESQALDISKGGTQILDTQETPTDGKGGTQILDSQFTADEDIIPSTQFSFKQPSPKIVQPILAEEEEDVAKPVILEQWLDKHVPKNMDELIVGMEKKKVEQVRMWLQDACKRDELRVLILHGPVGCGKSTCISILAKELSMELREWNCQSEAPTSINFDRNQSEDRANHPSIHVPYISQLDDFASFVGRSRFPALAFTSAERPKGSIRLVESLPYFQNKDRERFHSIMGGLLQPSSRKHKTVSVIIYSSESETTNPTVMRKLFSPEVVDSPYTTLISVRPVPPGRMKKVLTNILDAEHIQMDPVHLADVVQNADGDLRNAIQTLQFFAVGVVAPKEGNPKKRSKRKTKKQKQDDALSAIPSPPSATALSKRDAIPSMNHAVGKLIRGKTIGDKEDQALKAWEKAKRKSSKEPPSISDKETRAKLAYNPEQIARLCPLEPDGLVQFIHFNCPVTFQEIGELSKAFDVFSLADVLAQSGAVRGAGTWAIDQHVFPGEYVVSLAARAIPGTRTARDDSDHMRPIYKPQEYETNQNRKKLVSQLKERFPCQSMSTINDYSTFEKLISSEEQSNIFATMAAAAENNLDDQSLHIGEDDIEDC